MQNSIDSIHEFLLAIPHNFVHVSPFFLSISLLMLDDELGEPCLALTTILSTIKKSIEMFVTTKKINNKLCARRLHPYFCGKYKYRAECTIASFPLTLCNSSTQVESGTQHQSIHMHALYCIVGRRQVCGTSIRSTTFR